MTIIRIYNKISKPKHPEYFKLKEEINKKRKVKKKSSIYFYNLL